MAKSAGNDVLSMKWDAEAFLKELSKLSGFNAGMAAIIYRWGDDSSAKGLFSNAFAAKTARIIRKAIQTGTPPDGQFVNWAELDDTYKAWKKAHWGTDKPWSLGGNIIKNLKTHKTTAGYTVGLDKRVSVPRISYQGRGRSVKLETYASAVEYGVKNRFPGRPLFSPAIIQATQEDFPKLVNMVRKNIQKAIVTISPKSTIRKKGTGASLEDVVSTATRVASQGQQTIKGINADEAIIRSMNVAIATGGGDFSKTGSGNIDKDSTRREEKDLKKDMKSVYKSEVAIAGSASITEAEQWMKDHGF